MTIWQFRHMLLPDRFAIDAMFIHFCVRMGKAIFANWICTWIVNLNDSLFERLRLRMSLSTVQFRDRSGPSRCFASHQLFVRRVSRTDSDIGKLRESLKGFSVRTGHLWCFSFCVLLFAFFHASLDSFHYHFLRSFRKSAWLVLVKCIGARERRN